MFKPALRPFTTAKDFWKKRRTDIFVGAFIFAFVFIGCECILASNARETKQAAQRAVQFDHKIATAIHDHCDTTGDFIPVSKKDDDLTVVILKCDNGDSVVYRLE
jgi:hypothetical protein